MAWPIPELPPNFPRNALATTIVLAFVAALFCVLVGEHPKENEQIIDFLLGQLATFVAYIVNFHFSANREARP